MLIDVCQSSKPTLSLIDGIIGMEGAGPSAGEPRHLGALLISDNPYELDVVGCSLIGIPLDKVATIVASKNRGYTKMDINNIDFVNMNLEEFGTVQFKRPHSGGLGFIKGKFPRIISQRIEKIVLAKPTFDEKICVKCGECERACPPGAITMGEIVPIVDLNKCIRCFCCQELCSFKAVKVKSNKIVDKILRL
jgi:ferredoxin